ncbi:DUF3810 domain-containing protein [Raoultibacter phocaeensis]|uniref:DUF3810 domain-containing protein n=1 Tax=Raoultibacter phocaeensis TaxID=2479841 RepID=UPI001118CC3C|nr:DUF3810 domain-containing protein [Raoultibacter phocaeensis]
MKKYLLKRMAFIPLGIAAYLVTLYAQGHPDWTEQMYSRSVYPALSSAVGFLPSLVGFSVAEWFVVLFILFCLGYIVYYLQKIIAAKPYGADGSVDGGAPMPNKGGRGMTIYRGAMGAVAIACVVYFSFTGLCGLNYYRHTFTYHSGYAIEESSTEDLERLCATLADDMGKTREEIGDDVDLRSPEPGEFAFYAQHSVTTIQALAERYPVLERPLYSAPKPVLFSELMSDAGIGGVFFPFTMESNINTQMPFFTVPSTMAHELAHQCGFMREDEANFISYLACMQSEDALMRYSGLLLAFDHSLSALGKADPEAASRIRSGLSAAVQRDMEQRIRFWNEHEGVLTDVSRNANDMYLKANKQSDGVQSYGRMVDLLLAEQRAADERR